MAVELSTGLYSFMHFLLERALSLMSCSAGDGIPEPVTANVRDAIHAEGSPLLVGRDNRAALARRGRIILAALYAIQVFYSFFIM
mgnify:CR=1 FL=1